MGRAKTSEEDISPMRCLCGIRLVWIEKGRRLRCPVEGIIYEIPAERTGP